jgi:hypothetical protein
VLTQFDGLLWLLLMLGPLVFLQRALHRELQSVFLLLTRRAEITIAIFSLIFFPGVVLHELSHFVMAKLLRVRTGSFSLIPQRVGNGRLRMGYVETAQADVFRDALIGFAPLLTGGLFVAYAGNIKLGLNVLWSDLIVGDLSQTLSTIDVVLARPDFWLWFYLTVAVSSTMMPSSSDRQAWLPLLLAVGFLVGIGILMGVGSFLMETFGIPLNNGLRATAVVFGISISVQTLVLLPTWVIRKILNRLTGMQIVS